MKSEKITDQTPRQWIIDALKETEQKLLQATQNLGHPAYGHSSATTFGIDDMREELFDFLEVPKSESVS